MPDLAPTAAAKDKKSAASVADTASELAHSTVEAESVQSEMLNSAKVRAIEYQNKMLRQALMAAAGAAAPITVCVNMGPGAAGRPSGCAESGRRRRGRPRPEAACTTPLSARAGLRDKDVNCSTVL